MSLLRKYGIGDYPAEYNAKVHGPYDPSRWYGKPDTPFSEVKLSELPKWFFRRKFGPRAVAGAFSRGMWRWHHKYVLPKYGGLSYLLQFYAGASIFFYVLNYSKLKEHRTQKYHW